jgi:carbamate kinase
MSQLAGTIRDTHHVLITHGNGPQVGNLLLRSESSVDAGILPALPIDTCVADTIGGLGYLITRELRSLLGDTREIAALITTTSVDLVGVLPTKPIGKVYDVSLSDQLTARGWSIVSVPAGGLRRSIASPEPQAVLEIQTVRMLFDAGVVVVAGGGGGVPVTWSEKEGRWNGADAVVDKDLVSALIGNQLEAEVLLILTDIETAFVDYGTPQQRPIHNADVAEMRRYIESGAFGQGSMGPKVEAACRFIEGGGRLATICHLAQAHEGMAGLAGTRVTA